MACWFCHGVVAETTRTARRLLVEAGSAVIKTDTRDLKDDEPCFVVMKQVAKLCLYNLKYKKCTKLTYARR